MTKPNLEQVRDVVATMVERSTRGWIGEGEEIARELLDYIDGRLQASMTVQERGWRYWLSLCGCAATFFVLWLAVMWLSYQAFKDGR